jgi:WD40 repeat protein
MFNFLLAQSIQLNRHGFTALTTVTMILSGIMPGFTAPVLPVGISAERVTATANATTKRWEQARLINTLPEQYPIYGSANTVIVSPDGKLLAAAVGSENTTIGDVIKVWDLATGKLLHTFTGYPTFVTAIAFSPDSQTLATGDYHHNNRQMTVKLWDMKTGKLNKTLRRSQAPKPYGSGYYFPVTLTFSADGKQLLTAATTPVIQVWDIAQGKLVNSFGIHRETVRFLSLSPDGKMLTVTYVDGRVTLLNPTNGELLGNLDVRNLFTAEFTTNDTIHAVLEQQPKRRAIRTYDRKTASPTFTSIDFPADAWIEVSPDEKTIAVGDFKTGLKLYDLKSGKLLKNLGDRSSNFTFTPDGQTLIAQTETGIKIWR